uniref:Uncharacterized protein n=1 Tax=Anguilla anguilla TaxID=7936 RepID=A0A0E9RFB2_ANGAN
MWNGFRGSKTIRTNGQTNVWNEQRLRSKPVLNNTLEFRGFRCGCENRALDKEGFT